MSKYSDLNELFKVKSKEVHTKFEQYEKISETFIFEFMTILAEYMGIDYGFNVLMMPTTNNMKLYPVKDRDESTSYTPHGSMTRNEDLFIFGFSIPLKNYLGISVDFGTKVYIKYQDNEHVKVCVKTFERDEFVVKIGNKDSYLKFIHFLYDKMKETINKIELASDSKTRIGFSLN